MAGGFLAKTTSQFHQPESLQGRWDRAGFLGKVYHYLYNKPVALQALDRWHEIAKEEGISGAEMAYRWVVHDSALTQDDGLVIGATTIKQWESNLAGIQKGPLSSGTAAKINALWTAELKADSTYDNAGAVKAVMVSPM
jgi:aflatoxin B1 aldehyde reductase